MEQIDGMSEKRRMNEWKKKKRKQGNAWPRVCTMAVWVQNRRHWPLDLSSWASKSGDGILGVVHAWKEKKGDKLLGRNRPRPSYRRRCRSPGQPLGPTAGLLGRRFPWPRERAWEPVNAPNAPPSLPRSKRREVRKSGRSSKAELPIIAPVSVPSDTCTGEPRKPRCATV